MKTLLVTGANGFLGRECVAQLRAAQYRVITTDLVGSVDLAGDLSDEGFCKTLPTVDTVVHCAAVQYVSKTLPTLGRHTYFERNNVVATTNLVNQYASPDVHFVNVGTSMMYRQTGRAQYGVEAPKGGEGVYSESKEKAWAVVSSRPGVNACVVPCIIAGRGREGLFRSFVGTMHRWGIVVIPGNGLHPIHMVHVADVAALIACVVNARTGGLFNAGGPEPLSISQWVDAIEVELKLKPVRRLHLPLVPLHALSRALRYVPLAREQLLMLKFPHVLDVKESIALGWCPQRTNVQIVAETARALVA